jgi:outer membrane protein OmpA-like peptidoglycan-associated protein
MVAYRAETNKFEIKEFSRNLKENDFKNWNVAFQEEFSPQRYRIVNYARDYFYPGASTLDADAEATISDFASKFPRGQQARLVIFGHADETGSEGRNVELSKMRAWQTFCSLANAGVDRRGAVLAFFGSERPARYGNSTLSLQENRRSEMFALIPDHGSP